MVKTTKDDDGVWYEFEESPLMSTYLFMFVVGKFESSRATTKHGVELNIYTPVGRLSEGKYALDLGQKSLEYFEEYFGIKYPLKKLDLVSLHLMHVRAMENWGCITFHDYVILNDLEN